jgi:predicted nuclease of predicted toxin-antitoxin system
MRVLLDENLSHELRHSITNHQVVTVRYMGWGGLKNGALIAVAETEGIEVFVTGDRNIAYQQNLAGRRMAIVTLSAHNWPIIRDHLQTIASAVDRAAPGSFQFVECGEFRKR